jgi:hypothetical protein
MFNFINYKKMITLNQLEQLKTGIKIGEKDEG